MSEKQILDACCGSRMFWFNKHNPHVTFMDKRQETVTAMDRGMQRVVEIKPDVVGDFRNMPFDDNTFSMVVFDPPHLLHAGKNSWLAKKYGTLDETCPFDLRQGMTECMRVLKPNGTLIFKWNEEQIKLADLLEAIGYEPLFGAKRGKTHWLAFNKKWIMGNNVLFPCEKVTCIRCYAGYSLVLFDNGVEVKLDSNASADEQISTFLKDIENGSK